MTQPDPSQPRAAVIGIGFIGHAHIEALRRLNVPIAGVLGHEEGYTRREAAKLGLRPYLSLDELLVDPEVTVVHQCGPNDVHAGQNLRALAAGKHVFSEKPLGVSVEECERQLLAARQAGRRAAVNFTYRGYAAVQTLREIVRGGELGDVTYLRGHYLQDWLLYATDFNWRVGAPARETRAVSDIGSHLSDLARFVTGREPERVFARFTTLHPERRRPVGEVQTFAQGGGQTEPFTVTTEDQASLLVEYAGGVHANFELAQVAPGHKNDLELEVQGTRGAAVWRQERPEEIEIGTRENVRTVRLKDPGSAFTHYPGGHPEGYPDAITNVIRTFYTGLGGAGSDRIATFEDGLAAARFVEAAFQSHTEGRWVDTRQEVAR
ncbi:dehydrogenase [Deinococcus aetherius]|uniref:Dehydrogenase n=1 Tax=Deinococcus aetherius TaxID=200252 RepID=A0ABN6RH08_9DEIO|nr:Gfo/Idh/MocA family oxidoreductase [Deinococcus aetherius]BDP42635.1 dehydrogenase [Deinococcus aetherius]